MFKELINEIYEFINDINTIKEDLKNKEEVIVKLNEKISQRDVELEEKNKKIEELQNIINSKNEEIEKLKNQELDLTELNDAILKLEEALNA